MNEPADARKVRLGDLLVEQKVITDEQLQAALVEQKRTGPQARAACSPTWSSCPRTSCQEVLAEHLQIPFVDVRQVTLDPATVRLLPEALARRIRALVLQADQRGLTRRHGRSDRPGRLRRARGAPQAAAADRAAARRGPAPDHRRRLSAHRRDRLDRAGSARGHARGRHRHRAAGGRRGLARRAGHPADPVHVPGRRAGACLGSAHRAGRERAARAAARRRQPAGAEHRRPPRRRRAGHAPETDERPRHRREAPAAGRPLFREGRQQVDRRAHVHHADAVRRIGGAAPARSVHESDDARAARHADRRC